MNQVCIHLAPGFEEIEAVNTIDVIRRAGIKILIVSMTENLYVTGSHEITIKADILFTDVDYSRVNMIILPGGMPGSANLNTHEGLRKQIQEFFHKGKYLAAICAAPMVYGNLGLLESKEAVCYPGFEKYLKGANISDSLVIKSDNIITAKGPGAAIQFGLKIVEILIDKKTADELAMKMITN